MTSRQRRRQRRRGGVRSKLLFAAGGLLAVAVGAILGFGSWFLSVADEAPPLSKCKPATGGNSVLLAADGSRLGYVRSDIARAPVPIDRIGRNLQQATVAIEDQRFYQHNGVDYEGGLRALLENLSAGKVVQGGSTITMQLMRSLCFKHPQRTMQRKAQEAKLAVSYEQHHSKAQILDSYLNTASYGTVDGRTAVGVQAASRIYFSRPASRLSVEQAALLAGLPQAPSEYNPLLNPGAARQRRNEVLAKMADLGYISQARGRLAQQRGLALRPSNAYSKRREPYFFDYVEHALIDRYGVSEVRDGGLRVQTTIEPRYQAVGRDAIDLHPALFDRPLGGAGGNRPAQRLHPGDGLERLLWADQFNLAAQGHRQPGSTFKMFVLTTAIKQGIDPYHTYYTSKPLNLDLPQWGHWDVHTADEGYMGTVNIQQATVASDNTVFAQLDLDVGPQNVARTAHSMGVTTQARRDPSRGARRPADRGLAAGDGRRLRHPRLRRDPPQPDRDQQGHLPGGRVEHPEEADPRRVLPANVAYEVTRILHDNITWGTGTAAYTGCYGQAGKTGTTDNYVDAWFDGYQPNLATSVWVGYPQSNEIEMSSVHGITVFGGTFPADIWNAFYSGIGVPCDYFRVPTEPVRWAPFTGSFTASAPAPRASRWPGRTRRTGGRARAPAGGYDPNAYAPGAGTQQPVPAPAPAPSPPPPPPAPPPRLRPGGGRQRGRYLSPSGRRGVGLAGLAGLLLCAVPLAAPGTALVPAAVGGAPGWLLGPYGDGTGVGPGAYLALLASPSSPMCACSSGLRRCRGACSSPLIALLVAAFALAPPLLSQDVFSYISYARLGAEHGLNPYLHGPSAQPGDPAFPYVGWPDSASAYGPLFTLLSYPLGLLPVGAALWALKAVSAASVLGVAALCARLAARPGTSTRGWPPPSSRSTRWSSSTSSAAPTTTG